MISHSLLALSGLDFVFLAVRGGLRAWPVRCGEGCGPGQCGTGRAAGLASAVLRNVVWGGLQGRLILIMLPV